MFIPCWHPFKGAKVGQLFDPCKLLTEIDESDLIAPMQQGQIHQILNSCFLTTDMDWLLDVGADGVAPDEVAFAHEVEAVVGEVGAQVAVLVGEQGVEVDPCHTLAAGDLFKQDVGLDDDVVTALEQFPLAHIVVERQQALQVNLGPG